MSIVEATFLGRSVRGGVSSTTARVLAAVEADLRATFAASGAGGDLATWAGVAEAGGQRTSTGLHGTGSAVDLNASSAPYIATRTGSTYGGEAGALDAEGVRRRACEVYDRACAFMGLPPTTADVSIRVNDTIEATYDRFRHVSDALVYYFEGVIATGHTRVNRAPVPHVETLPDGDRGFDAIAAAEIDGSRPDILAMLTTLFASPDWVALHPGWTQTPEACFWQVLRDYELVRTPMLFGNASDPVTSTRNPARGFLPFRRELVVSMIRAGDTELGAGRQMRWGASDFGAAASGDVMHFDLGRNMD